MQEFFTINKKTSRLVEISTPFNIVENYKDNSITSLQCGDTTLNTDDYINIQIDGVNVKYKVRKINKNSEGNYTLISYCRNRTTSYLLPCLGISRQKLFLNSYFINAYLDIDNSKSLNGKFLYLAYRFIRGEKYRYFESLITKYPNYYKTIDVSPNLVVYAFTIPKEHWEDMNKFKNAEYSKFSSKLKEKIRVFNGVESIQYKVVMQSPFYIEELEKFLGCKIPKGNELDSIPNMNDEILTDYD